ncbi:alpha/beta fold hydrolase [Micromonospora andamanensis]|uniref:AB hydrolase-1 domain-containing protein n=1 Tax=Micromonospora andamanensis TaxID=1287068 RepID=A0ABQ4HTE5_9ACTN|nr:alpha/beta hydrolase [Micromonospora andamanensis]GIJ08934.1 hypothetical protein Van01_21480 [Micromonospora andamanensis]
MSPAAEGIRWLADGPPGAPLAVLAHGLEDSWRTWLPLAADLGQRWRVAALDLPWQPGTDYRWRQRPAADALADAIVGIGADISLLVAHSYGANATLHLLCRDALPARRVALICPLYRPPGRPVTWTLFDRARTAFERHIHESLRSRQGDRLARTPDDVLATMTRKAIDRAGPAGFLAVFEQYVTSAALPLDRVRPPVLVLGGGDDPTLTPAAAGALAGALPDARLIIDDRYDHFCHLRHPAEVAARLCDFAASPKLEEVP